jgi:hypothetical protein
MKRIVALVFVVAVLMSTVFGLPVAATPGDSQDRATASLARGMERVPMGRASTPESVWALSLSALSKRTI